MEVWVSRWILLTALLQLVFGLKAQKTCSVYEHAIYCVRLLAWLCPAPSGPPPKLIFSGLLAPLECHEQSSNSNVSGRNLAKIQEIPPRDQR